MSKKFPIMFCGDQELSKYTTKFLQYSLQKLSSALELSNGEISQSIELPLNGEKYETKL